MAGMLALMPRQPPLQHQIKQHHCLAPCEATIKEASRWLQNIGNRTEAMTLAIRAKTSLQG